jgi:hypothetical protein
MNILISSSRMLSPIDEWCLMGTKRLIEYAHGSNHQWIIFDKSLSLPPSLTRERKQGHNTFHHQVLGPIQVAALTGADGWSGPEMEGFYRALARTELPLWAMGLELPKTAMPFSDAELSCFSRPAALISVTNEISKEWLRRFDLEAALMCPPIVFAYDSPGNRRQLSRGARPKIAWVLQDRRHPDLVPEKLIRQSVRQVQRLSEDFEIEKLCLTTDDFMRFGVLFKGQVKYSYEAREYLDVFLNSDLIVTSNTHVALAANSCEKPAILLTLEKMEPDPHKPFIFPCSPLSIAEGIGEALAVPNINSHIASWKDEKREEWQKLMAPHATTQTKAA